MWVPSDGWAAGGPAWALYNKESPRRRWDMPITKGTQVLLVRCALCKGKALATRKPGAGDDFIVDEMRRRNYRVAVVDGEPRWVCYRHEPPEVELSDLIPTMDIGDLDRPSERVDPAGDASVASPKSPASGSGTSVASAEGEEAADGGAGGR
jgi:hypothetical protein